MPHSKYFVGFFNFIFFNIKCDWRYSRVLSSFMCLSSLLHRYLFQIVTVT